MNPKESTESVEFSCKKDVVEPSRSCVINQHATTAP